jgi:ferredoxin
VVCTTCGRTPLHCSSSALLHPAHCHQLSRRLMLTHTTPQPSCLVAYRPPAGCAFEPLSDHWDEMEPCVGGPRGQPPLTLQQTGLCHTLFRPTCTLFICHLPAAASQLCTVCHTVALCDSGCPLFAWVWRRQVPDPALVSDTTSLVTQM